MPKVSVVLPTFERWPLLLRALTSVLDQTDVDLEVLVIDDCSSDGTPARLGAIADPRLRVLRQETNQGVARARNRAIEAAQGEWVAFLDDDDFWAPTCLREHRGQGTQEEWPTFECRQNDTHLGHDRFLTFGSDWTL